ncbi:hypothetical protein S7711_05645 [Stachybotrys chartarum IBT 7711]|uniref:Uncharacterized protein n=1 Tax=Stachybotrys chartarum (strain CBS 109288 / IBT 7711) TaxID=1280523 RepID=A0A084B4U7_STACB|nr:hypothetical protein S7711_05645 [Stachybotrys chartarum IBT 7711]KFA53558.1 hypothetical protein S40293_09150 [Stachybotrys chartarum IBT 40293]KFA80409.1 hypothetical protein S40288_08815 [Stachybotrys chartarum IBT 40288]
MSDQANSNYLYTVGAYATLIGVGYAVYHVSTQKTKKRTATVQPKVARAAQPEPRKEDRKKKQRLERFASEPKDASSKPNGESDAGKGSEPAWLSNTPSNAKGDDGPDNREFAKQLAKAKAGKTFSNKSEGGKQREKSVKQSRANQLSGNAEKKKGASASSSVHALDSSADADEDTAGDADVDADADDQQQSPATPAESGAVDVSGVADMLEPAPAAPSILRITDTASKQKPKVAKAPEAVETKKQRQNRKKAEAAKAERQEAEKERKALEEKQRRQARIAEGRAAKDGSQFVAANGNKSAWTQGAPNGSSTKTSEGDVLHQPLDTFEESGQAAPKSESKAEPRAAAKPQDTWKSSLPSEEEQIELLKDETDEWSTVKTKSSKKSTKKGSSADSSDEAAQSRPAPVAKQPVNGSKPAAPQSFGSFSALTTKNEPADEAEEEEWDV